MPLPATEAAAGLEPSRLTVAGELELRYCGQSYTLTVPFCRGFREEFQARHQRLYGHDFPEREVEAVVLRLHFLGPETTEGLPPFKLVANFRGALPRLSQVWLPKGPAYLPLYYRPRLAPGYAFWGPALVVEDYATLLVLPGFRGEVLPQGHVLLTRPQETKY
ncbi:MAG: hypothetical protein Q8M54_11125 [Desulfobaccales bacterium]|nr:hypothetical protein [Desulfobaccales bacterium]